MKNKYIKQMINKKNISIRKLSYITKLNDSHLGKIINGKTKNPGIDYLLAIAKALDLNEQEFAELCGYKVNRQSCIPLEIKNENDIHYGGNPLLGEWITGTCPRCKKDVQLGMNYCSNCGQKLLWENLENEKS